MSASQPIGGRRHRITLMAEERELGAGGRSIQTTPIIADVWAEASLEAASQERAGGQSILYKAAFSFPYVETYLRARVVEWDGRKYRISSLSVSGVHGRQVEIRATEIL